jgi:acetyl/propionyl-CoA carboxylase alpha subunit
VFKRVLIANRGEIALRVQRTCRELGIETVAVYSEPDRNALHVRQADYSVCIGPGPSTESYLVIDKIIEAAKQTGAEAIHPGYGFLSENPRFVDAIEASGIAFIGPPASAMRALGDKVSARKLMESAGVPVVPGANDISAADFDTAPWHPPR